MTLHFSGNANTRSVSAILFLAGQILVDTHLVLVSFDGTGGIEDVSGKKIHVSNNSLGIAADETGVTIPVFDSGWGTYRIILFDELSVTVTYAS